MIKFFKKETDIDLLNNEINNLQFKKKSILAVLQDEIDNYNKSKLKIYETMGSTAYESYKINKISYDFSMQFKLLEDLDKSILEHDIKYSELNNRYDEEISFLKANLSSLENYNSEFEPKKSFYKQYTDIKSSEQKCCPYCGQKRQ